MTAGLYKLPSVFLRERIFMTKYGLIVSDPHCGHLIGLTPPEFQLTIERANASNLVKYYDISRELWETFTGYLKTLPPLDFVVWGGDLIDGKGLKSGGTELLTTSMKTQCDMAIAVNEHIRKYCKPKVKIIGVTGTDYHTTTNGDDWERFIADEAGFMKIGHHEWLDVNGLIFDIKHKVGSSGIPHGRHTAVAKEALWNSLWAEVDMQPKSDVILRGHVHYHSFCGNPEKLCMTLPSLQGMGSRYGAKECSGIVDWGAILFEVKSKNDYNWYPFIRKIVSQKAKTVMI